MNNNSNNDNDDKNNRCYIEYSSNDDDRCYIEYRKIPTILLLQIIGYLNNIDLICLLLTCKSYYYDLKDQYSSSITFKGLDRIQHLQQRYDGTKNMFIHSKGPYQLNGFTSLYRNAISDQLMVGRDFGAINCTNRVDTIHQIPVPTTETNESNALITTLLVGTQIDMTKEDKTVRLPPTITRLSIRKNVQPLVTAAMGLPNLKELYVVGYQQSTPNNNTIQPSLADTLHLDGASSLRYLCIRNQSAFEEVSVPRNLETLALLGQAQLDKIQGLSSSCIKTMDLCYCETYGLDTTMTPILLPRTLTSLNIKVEDPLPDTFVFPPMLVSLTYQTNASDPLNIQNLVHLERLVLTVPNILQTRINIIFPPVTQSSIKYIDLTNTTTKIQLQDLNTSCIESFKCQHISQIQYDETTTTMTNLLPNLKRFKGQVDYYQQIATLSTNLQILSTHCIAEIEFPKDSFQQLKKLTFVYNRGQVLSSRPVSTNMIPLPDSLTSFSLKRPTSDLYHQFPPNLISMDYSHVEYSIIYIPSSLESLSIRSFKRFPRDRICSLPTLKIINNNNQNNQNNQNNNNDNNNNIKKIRKNIINQNNQNNLNYDYLPSSLKRLSVNMFYDSTPFRISEIIRHSNVESLRFFCGTQNKPLELELSIRRLEDDRVLIIDDNSTFGGIVQLKYTLDMYIDMKIYNDLYLVIKDNKLEILFDY
ncbi:hypothetical protein DFA_04046 [Cavenderia fasciculata]|uniref:F-box domain-containing protein n=1 Tax=Cavenderia fasciculata TaxID=261658 RepID=F4Q151_CACFS|nr:uncharacterized protein DFA_04046 [Cavenderia fasciculata]EGG18552.1 hypothetical protein DFA_04046 [Cavenderia fasciculata]|eukprot:XP_004366456.1 hypothetical protein DFA_04046 [Cavenderia fasciculata]